MKLSKKNSYFLLQNIIIIFLGVWFLFSFFSLGLNFFKAVVRERSEYFMTDEEIRKKYFGTEFEIVQKLNEYIPNNTEVLYITDSNSELNFMSKYFLYPKKVKHIFDYQKNLSEVLNGKYILASFSESDQSFIFEKLVEKQFSVVFETHDNIFVTKLYQYD